jgi:hypothetical protein
VGKSNKLIAAEPGISEGTFARCRYVATDTNVSTKGYYDAIAAGLRI